MTTRPMTPASLTPTSLTLDEYQALARRTLDGSCDLVWNVLGLTGEAGEVAEYFKKVLYHKHPEDPEKVRKELGDVLWYVAAIASWLGLSLGDIAAANIAKLKERYPDGFSPEASLARQDEEKARGARKREDPPTGWCRDPAMNAAFHDELARHSLSIPLPRIHGAYELFAYIECYLRALATLRGGIKVTCEGSNVRNPTRVLHGNLVSERAVRLETRTRVMRVLELRLHEEATQESVVIWGSKIVLFSRRVEEPFRSDMTQLLRLILRWMKLVPLTEKDDSTRPFFRGDHAEALQLKFASRLNWQNTPLPSYGGHSANQIFGYIYDYLVSAFPTTDTCHLRHYSDQVGRECISLTWGDRLRQLALSCDGEAPPEEALRWADEIVLFAASNRDVLPQRSCIDLERLGVLIRLWMKDAG